MAFSLHKKTYYSSKISKDVPFTASLNGSTESHMGYTFTVKYYTITTLLSEYTSPRNAFFWYFTKYFATYLIFIAYTLLRKIWSIRPLLQFFNTTVLETVFLGLTKKIYSDGRQNWKF